ncbi:MAG TPA: FliA/WhiG family RNA polymerase sigma factor [Verrucomicrobiae bacterium]|nr:FliA/WhiG family RNA polymerase sigma factor [Verrucomicrobiae bacterium]
MNTCPAPVLETTETAAPATASNQAWAWQAKAGPTKSLAPNAQDLWKRYHQHSENDADTENALVQKYMPLVSAVMGRLAMTLPEHVSQDDLYSAGLVGMLQALRNFDPGCNTSFETYARVRIRGAMLDELRRMDWVPRTIHEKARKLKAVLLELEQKLGRTPTEAQMAKAMKLSADEYQELLDEVRPAAFVCLDAVSSSDEGDGGALYEIIADNNGESPLDNVSNNELKQVVFERLKELPEMQRKVLALYYLEDMHLREIAEVFGLTESRICQIHAQAVIALRAFVQRFESGVSGKTSTAAYK